MEVKNGIIIDGVLHELKETKRNDCLKCSLRDLCQNEFGYACLCWINLYSLSEIIHNEFKCRGKVTDIKIDKGNNYGIYDTVLYTQKHTGASEEAGRVGIFQRLS